MHVDPGWLLPSVSSQISLSADTISDFKSSLFLLCCVLFLSTFPLYFLICLLLLLLVFPLFFACLGFRENGGLGAVCLKPSRVNLLRPSTVRKDCISQFPLLF